MKKNIIFGSTLGGIFLSTVAFADDHKTVADVADKALDVFVSVANQMKTMAPEVWAIVLRQQYIEATASIIEQCVYIFGFVIFVFLLRKTSLLKQSYKSYDDADKANEADAYVIRLGLGSYIPVVILFVMLCSLVGNVSYASKVYANPEYYAIKSMTNMIHK